ncbi:MAG: hypothetical protein HQ541_23655, partial [Mariniphaga sp.]|nr:hypothetical protein [Mariniphaga sp.]
KKTILSCISEYINNDQLSKLIESEVEKKKIIYIKRHSTLTKGYLYAEALSGAQNYFNLLINGNKKDHDYLNKKVLMQLIENAVTDILIIDERVFKFYENADEEIKKRWDFANISVINDKELGNKSELFSAIEKKCKERITKFLIIHQGVIDKIIQNDNDDSFKTDEKNLLNSLKKYAPYIVVTSGRGKPDKIPNGVKFLPYSSIADTLMKPYHEKFLLTNILLKLSAYEN